MNGCGDHTEQAEKTYKCWPAGFFRTNAVNIPRWWYKTHRNNYGTKHIIRNRMANPKSSGNDGVTMCS